eukprot:Phypoly_transcript_00663.p1 GENE.Phypoly_transcript_00663~~Phypoly_transcript_00663.p1  ORF type:complete len:1097 (+),score=133.55 Phypoly_transcript_00663:927-4217(+)
MTFHESQQIYRGEVEIDQWAFLRMLVFDNAAFPTQHEPYEERYSHILDAIAFDYPVYINAFRMLCTSKDLLKSALKEIIVISGGEGIILQKRRSPYEQGRSTNLFKIKALRGDSEALVQRVAKNFVQVQLPLGKSFRIPKANVAEGLHLKGGDIVTLEYDTVFREIPVDPIIARVRTDTLWEAIVDDSGRNVSKNKDVLAKAPKGYWKAQDGKAREHFIEFAMKRGLDPLLPATWYSMSYSTLLQSGASLMHLRSRGGYIETLLSVFPDIGLDPRKFQKDLFFSVVQNRREFFDNYAKDHNFDPLIEGNWYSVDMRDLMNTKGAKIVARYYGGIKIALRHLYPELKIDPTKYEYQADFYIKTVRRREIFNEFAAANRFDPLVPENWYSIARERILALKNSTLVRNFYQRQVTKALLDVYPDIGLEREKLFIHISSSFWAVVKNRRTFFDEFAKENAFDPLVPSNWYNVPRHKIVAKKGAFPVLGYYNKNYAKALMHLYPNIGLELDKFGILPSGHWNEIRNHREFFDNFALSRGFEPLVAKNWYSVTQQQVLETKYSRVVLGFYKGSFINALLSLYPSIGLAKLKFEFVPREFWRERANRREYFDSLAQVNGFDPLIPSNWYSLPKSRIHERKGGYYIAALFEGNEFAAIVDAYPELNLEEKKFEYLPLGYWADEGNRKSFFDSFARSRNFDPLIADNWHKTKSKTISAVKHARSVLAYYNGSYVTAVTSIYPDIGIDRNKFSTLPSNYWRDPMNRRNFFDALAKKHGFDPLIRENWYKVSGRKIRKSKGGETILKFYNDQVGEALLQLYPDIGLEPDHLKFSEGIWVSSENRKKLFDSFAAQKGFDPLIAQNWHSIGKKDFVASVKGASNILKYYQNSFIRALMDIYPNIGLDIHKFAVHRGGYWMVAENRKRFFDEYADNHGFDPLSADSWYQVSKQSIFETKYSDNVLKYYRYSVANALLHLYPNIGLDAAVLSRSRDHWKKIQNRKAFFDSFAKANGFDPLVPSNWYQVPQHKIREQKEAMNVLGFYNNNFVVALMKLYPNIGLDVVQFSKDLNIKPESPPNAKNKFDPSLAAVAQLFPELGVKAVGGVGSE